MLEAKDETASSNGLQGMLRMVDSRMKKAFLSAGILVTLLAPRPIVRGDGARIANLAGFQNPAGTLETNNQAGAIDLTGPFFQSFGTNGRSCGTCHQASDGMSV